MFADEFEFKSVIMKHHGSSWGNWGIQENLDEADDIRR